MGQGGVPGSVPDLTRDLNYSMPAVRDFYSHQNDLFLEDGVQFFWNDEGEDDYFTFTEWSQSELAGLRASATPTRRYFSISAFRGVPLRRTTLSSHDSRPVPPTHPDRAFSPGAAALGVTVWTGDVSPSWGDLQNTPGYVVQWALAGAPYVTCDIGGFSGETNALLLTRWYGVGVFMPVMRVHSVIGTTPHFPFPELWGAEASDAMRSLLEWRYALLPHLYSLAYEAHTAGVPPCRAMRLVFPDDPGSANLTQQWMLGDTILAAPVLTEDNATSAYLPPGVWFEWGTTATHIGPTTLSLADVPLAAVPVYVAAGAVLALAPPVEYSDALPGGPLHVTVYGGADGAFTLYEDDGETTAYEAGAAATFAATALRWNDAAGCLSWARTGGFNGPHSFVQLDVTLFKADGSVARAAAQPISASGTACPT